MSRLVQILLNDECLTRCYLSDVVSCGFLPDVLTESSKYYKFKGVMDLTVKQQRTKILVLKALNIDRVFEIIVF